MFKCPYCERELHGWTTHSSGNITTRGYDVRWREVGYCPCTFGWPVCGPEHVEHVEFKPLHLTAFAAAPRRPDDGGR